ncbi:hypothetical protein PCA31118_02733 [Pandoraea captiosa]|uniref:Uncharacterized protein n=1 Tax=Pandoraea captiosa TaxID=2508302 RepID=A0A5E5A2W0_9BURK|nr:hypothetical protein PCA31118_02733 [Pandoraea captiosa]
MAATCLIGPRRSPSQNAKTPANPLAFMLVLPVFAETRFAEIQAVVTGTAVFRKCSR